MFEEASFFEGDKPSSDPAEKGAYAALKFDPAPYMHYLNDADLNDAQKAELLETLWQIMVHFVDLGIGISPIQEVLDKSENQKSPLEAGFSAVVKSTKNTTNKQKKKPRPAPKSQP